MPLSTLSYHGLAKFASHDAVSLLFGRDLAPFIFQEFNDGSDLTDLPPFAGRGMLFLNFQPFQRPL